jgi:hypothetical protein
MPYLEGGYSCFLEDVSVFAVGYQCFLEEAPRICRGIVVLPRRYLDLEGGNPCYLKEISRFWRGATRVVKRYPASGGGPLALFRRGIPYVEGDARAFQKIYTPQLEGGHSRFLEEIPYYEGGRSCFLMRRPLFGGDYWCF